MRKYTGVTFTVAAGDTASWERLGNLIPDPYRPALVLWALADDIDAFYLKKIRAGKHFWKPVSLEKRNEYVLVVTHVNGTGWTHKEVLDFLDKLTVPEGITVLPLSDDEALQVAMRHNVLNGHLWHRNLSA